MAPLVPPPPVISLEEAKDIEKKMTETTKTEKPLLRKHGSRLMSLISSDPRQDVPKFTGKEFVDWAVHEKIAKDPEHAVKVGQALLEHRLAHHFTDDAEFENSSDQYYSFISQEPIEVKMMHAALGQYIAHPEIFYQTKLELRSKNLFGSERWTPIYAVLDDPASKPRMIHFFKRYHAASPPIESYAVEDCMCSLEECLDCKTDWYCFSLVAKKRSSGKDTHIVACADHSKRLEGWLSALMAAGVEFTKEDEGQDISQVKSLFELSARRLNSKEIIPFSQFRGGLTPRDYTELVQLYDMLHDRGFEILAFPCNQFGGQEPHDEETICKFVAGYAVKFQMFEKIQVNGSNAHPVFRFLKGKLGGVLGSSIKWNFTKFLCDKNGIPIKRYGPPVAPLSIKGDIEELLNQ